MVQAILEDAIADCEEGARDAKIGHVPSGENQCACTPCELRHFDFQRFMFRPVASDQMRSPAADSITVCSDSTSLDHFWVACKT